MKFGLELVAIIRPNFSNAKGELFNDVINEVDRICLSVFVVNFQRSYTCCIIDCRVLEPAHLITMFSLKCQELDIYLDMVTWHLFLVTLGVQLPHSGTSRQPVKAIAFEDTVYPRIRYFDAVVARQVPNDPDRSQVIFAAQIQDLFDNLWRRLIGRVLWNRFDILQTSFAMLLIRIPPSIKAGSPNPEIPTCFAGIADLLGMLKHSQFTLDVSFFVCHENFLHPKLDNLQEVSRESVHIYKQPLRKCTEVSTWRATQNRSVNNLPNALSLGLDYVQRRVARILIKFTAQCNFYQILHQVGEVTPSSFLRCWLDKAETDFAANIRPSNNPIEFISFNFSRSKTDISQGMICIGTKS